MAKARRYDADEYIQAYRERGVFPKIHDDLFTVIGNYALVHRAAMDIGGSIGMISRRLIEEVGVERVVAVEPHRESREKALPHPLIQWVEHPVHEDYFPLLGKLIDDRGITLVTARRVLSEVGMLDISQLPKLGEMLAESGVTEIALEGRVRVQNPTCHYWNSDLEAEGLGPLWKVAVIYKEVRLLRRA